MVVKLKAYRLQGGYKEQWSVPALSGLSKVTVLNKINYGSRYTDAQIVAVENSRGIIGRLFSGDVPGTSGSQKTQATALSIDLGDNVINTSAWSAGNPVGGTVVMNVIGVVNPITQYSEDILDVTDSIIEDTINITRQIESLDKFDLRLSRASFSLHESTDINTFLGKFWNPDGYENNEYIIVIDIEGYFWGISDFDNINYDEVEKTYHFDCYDPIKWLQKNIWGLRLPSLGGDYRNLSGFLYATCNLIGKTVIIDVDGGQDWSIDFVYIGTTEGYYQLDYHLTIADMMVEIMKHYGATIYFDANGNLNFATRNKQNVTDYDETVMLEELNKSYESHEYAGLLINVKGDWKYTNGVWSHWQGWVLVWEAYGELQTTVVNANLNDIPKNFSYLDLRQELPSKVFTYRMFAQRTREEIYSDYKELFRSSVLYETTLDGVDYQLYDTISINGENYTMNYLQINFNEENTQIRAYKSL